MGHATWIPGMAASTHTNKQTNKKTTKTKQSETKQNNTAGVDKDMERLECALLMGTWNYAVVLEESMSIP